MASFGQNQEDEMWVLYVVRWRRNKYCWERHADN